MNQDLLRSIVRPRIIKSQVTHVSRFLSGKGTILVSLGQEVTPTDVIGKFELSSGFFTINLAKKLSISPSDALKALSKPIGSRIYQGELLASHANLLSKTDITSPTDGIIQSLDPQTGELSLKFFPKMISLVSGVYGIVDSIDSLTGQIWIKTLATQIFGLAGVGKPRMGLLKSLSTPSDILTVQAFKPEYSQHILVCGAKLETGLITQAIQIGATGLIAGGIDWRDFTPLINQIDQKANLVTDPGVGLMAFEGFGPIAIPDDINTLLITNQEKFVYLDGHRKVLLIPDSSPDAIQTIRKTTLPIRDTAHPEDLRQITIGQTVRLVWPSTLGVTGKIIAIDKAPTMLESGIPSYLLTIETSSRKIRVPFQNIEII